MKLHPKIEMRIKKICDKIGWTREQLLEKAVKDYLGMEGMTLEDETIYGREDEQKNRKQDDRT